MKKCIEHAKKNNLEISRENIKLKILDLNLNSAKYKLLPDLNLSLNNSLTLGISNIPITNSNQQNIGNETIGYKRYFSTFGINSNIDIYKGGKAKLEIEKTRIDYHTGELSVEELERNITIEILNSYLKVILYKELVRVAQEQVHESSALLEKSTKLFEIGTGSLSKVYDAEFQLATDRQVLSTEKINADRALINLAYILQLSNNKSFDIEDLEMPKSFPIELIDHRNIVLNDPTIRKTENNINSLIKIVEIDKTSYYPHIYGGYRLGTFYDKLLGVNAKQFLDQIYENQTHYFFIGLSFPIFNRFQNKINIEKSILNLEIEKSNLEIQKENLNNFIQNLIFDVETTYYQYIKSNESVKYAERSFALAKKSLDAGVITDYDFNTSKKNLFNAKSEMLRIKYNYFFKLKILELYSNK